MEGSTLKLVMLQGPRGGETLEFRPGAKIRIGRVVKGNNLPIKDAGISSKHLSVDFESGKWVIRDLDSSNGTLLNNSKLLPMSPFDLGDGDAIKIGEYTSIEVKICGGGCESQLRRNPRRGRAAAKDGVSENVAPVAEDRGRRGGSRRGKGLVKENGEQNLGLVKENCDEKLETVVPVAENRPRRAGLRSAKVLKEDDKEADQSLIGGKRDGGSENMNSIAENHGQQVSSTNATGLDLVGERCDGELEKAAAVVEENGRRRGRPRRARALKNEATEKLGEVKQAEKKENVGLVQQLNSRRTRSTKNKEQLVSNSMVQNIVDTSSLDRRESDIDDRGKQEDLSGKINLQVVASEAVKIDVSEVKENVEILDLRDEGLEAVEISVAEDKQNAEGLDMEHDPCKESASGPGIKEICTEVNNEVDLEKMTLGEWFDYLEVHLPKQIYNVTEEMIASMREKAERFREFMLQQQNEKGKLPVG